MKCLKRNVKEKKKMQERNENYRRHQEATHYKRRLKISIEKLHRYVMDADGDMVPDFYGKNFGALIDHSHDNVEGNGVGWGCRDRSLEQQKANKHRNWMYLLKNNSIPSGISPRKDAQMPSYYRTFMNRKVRRFAKMVEYPVPTGKYLVRASISKGEPKELE